MEAKKLTPSDMDNVRNLLLGQNNKLIKQTMEEDARALVTKVISEAIHDRQQQDASLTNAMTPLIESAVEKSIENNKSKFVSYLYPIVGSLVRKSVSVFFNGFLEKLNYLIEYSLTFKGLKWRFHAWRQGVPFTQYILKQTFNYRVEQVFFIHRETGALLCSASTDNSQFNDPNLVSAMLTAINDFVADSFNADTSDHLDTVKTKDLTLAIEAGPQALLVAAVSGNMPNDIKALLKHTLEQLHALYISPLTTFDGDDTNFASAEPQLRECLISELSEQGKKQSKKKLLAWLTLGLLAIPVIYLASLHWQTKQLTKQMQQLELPAGIVAQSIAQTGLNSIEFNYLTDPQATALEPWLIQQNINTEYIHFTANNFASTDADIILKKAETLINQQGIYVSFNNGVLAVTGNSNTLWSNSFIKQLTAIAGVSAVDTSKLAFPTITQNTSENNLFLLNHIQGQLSQYTIDFDVESSTLTPDAKEKLSELAPQLTLAIDIATQLNLPFGVIISGFSDASGNKTKNLALSQLRADKTKAFLVTLGVNATALYAVGVGELKLTGFEQDGRKVIFSAMQLNPMQLSTEHLNTEPPRTSQHSTNDLSSSFPNKEAKDSQ